ncbi:hypothetical protein PUN4_150057 [Paraburkholderia unamae]|nr:hypothetical protein PUN4_150057 [Paraburkholderia unamae]
MHRIAADSSRWVSRLGTQQSMYLLFRPNAECTTESLQRFVSNIGYLRNTGCVDFMLCQFNPAAGIRLAERYVRGVALRALNTRHK